MTQEFRLEDPGEGIHEAEIKEVQVAEGDEVSDGDVILTVETDKAAVEVPAPFSGTIEEICVEVGDIAKVGEVIMRYRATDEGAADGDTSSGDGATEQDAEGEKDAREAETKRKESKDEKDRRPEEEARQEKRPPGEKAAGQAKKRARRDAGPVPASPATRRLARELNVDLESVEASGPQGRVTADDVRSAAGQFAAEAQKQDKQEKEAGPPRKKARQETEPREAPDFAKWGEIERLPLRSIRRTIAKRISRSWTEIPHVMHQDEADITDLEQWRKEHQELAEEHGGKLTLTVLIMKSLVATLKVFPRFNASLDPEKEEIVLKRYYHIGVAVDTEQGLVVPVVRDVDRKSVLELSAELVRLADKARRGELAPEDMQGGSFTITNPGPIGGRVLTPIINYPQVAILGLGQARLEPRIRGDLNDFEVVPRLILPLCLAFDHRVNDGADAARFAASMIDTLSDSESVLMAA